VTHLCGAPIVYGMLINAPESQRAGIAHAIDGLIRKGPPLHPVKVLHVIEPVAVVAKA
jgi:hypothetical protein